MTENNGTFGQSIARIAVAGYDDAQDMRTSMMNRVRDIVRKRNEGIPFDEVEEEKDPDEQNYDAKYADDNLPELIEEMLAEDRLTDEEYEYLNKMLEAGQGAARVENRYKDIMRITESEPIFEEWLRHVYGVSTTLTAKLIHQFGYCDQPEREKVSNLWSYAGLAPGQKRTRGEKLGYNPQAKTLAWLVADRIVMQGDKSRYKTEFYDPYKAKQVDRMNNSMCEHCGEPTFEHMTVEGEDGRACPDTGKMVTLDDFDIVGVDAPDEATPPWQQGHADTRARRYLAKKFLKAYWYVGRSLVGAPTPDEWVITHGGHDNNEDSFENPAVQVRMLTEGQPHSSFRDGGAAAD